MGKGKSFGKEVIRLTTATANLTPLTLNMEGLLS